MENILTFTGFVQLMLSVWAHDRMTTIPGLILGLVLFAILVAAVRQILEDSVPAPRRIAAVKVKKVNRVVYR